ncbi:MAG TPA: phage portal protein, partial [Armatimonadota bacterium]|nr:phage portal protein [Armatimonadota bacterium]
GQGLSYEATSRDMSQVNYSSARQGLLEDQSEYAIMQQFLVAHLLDEVYSEFVISAVLSNALPMPGFWSDKYRYLEHEFIARGWSWIDPQKEADANATALDTGQTTLAATCAAQGADWREVLAQRAQELAAARALEEQYRLPEGSLLKSVKAGTVKSEP